MKSLTALKRAVAIAAIVIPLRPASADNGGPLFTSRWTGTCQQETIKSREGWLKSEGNQG